MKQVILTDDKNNTVHDFSFDCLSCNHIPLDEDEYEVVEGEETDCPDCIYMDGVYDEGVKIISKMMDEDILDDMNRVMSENKH